jgi:hypothetical protein
MDQKQKYRPARLLQFVIALTMATLVSGCRHSPAPLNYQLVRQGSAAILIPPAHIAAPSAPVFDFSLKNARRSARPSFNCDIESEVITLRWRGRTARLSLKPTSFSTAPAPGNAEPNHQTIFLDPLQNLEKFRGDLEKLETNGCLSSGEAARLRVAISEKLPLPPDAAYRFRYGSFDLTGRFDLTSDFRLQIVTPVYSTATADSTKQTIGFETAYYVFKSAPNEDRVRISLSSVTETDRGKPPVAKSAASNPLPFPDVAGYFRIAFRTDASASEHITIATILSAPDRNTLEEATRQRESGPADSCEAVTAPRATCMTFPPKIGVGPELRVLVNGQEAFVQIGGSVADAIGFNKPLMTIVKTLQVRRLYQGRLIPVKFDPTTKDILNFVLMPGDQITW